LHTPHQTLPARLPLWTEQRNSPPTTVEPDLAAAVVGAATMALVRMWTRAADPLRLISVSHSGIVPARTSRTTLGVVGHAASCLLVLAAPHSRLGPQPPRPRTASPQTPSTISGRLQQRSISHVLPLLPHSISHLAPQRLTSLSSRQDIAVSLSSRSIPARIPLPSSKSRDHANLHSQVSPALYILPVLFLGVALEKDREDVQGWRDLTVQICVIA